VRRLLLCSGKIYYDLDAARRSADHGDVALVRFEQLYPFPDDAIAAILTRYSRVQEIAWVQEEPRNMGAWRFMEERIQPLLESPRRALRYVGRPESASPAAGSLKRHQQEQAELIEEAFAPGAIARKRVRLVPKRQAR
jgi:2-oxoglutarate dehydrogenase E1 component